MLEQTPAIFSEQKVGSSYLGFIQLNRPKAINSLNLVMARSIYDKLIEWQDRKDIACVFIYSEVEKGFCAGGDVKEVVLSLKKDTSYSDDFFKYEYLMDELLSRFPKPTICWGSGIVMGGGFGLMQACSHRIATDTSILAMPEVAIGFFPDVGASYFLNQLPDNFGKLLGLTGYRISGEEAVELGLANTILSSKTLSRFITDLLSLKWSKNDSENFKSADELFANFDFKPKNSLNEMRSETTNVFEGNDLHECLSRWENCRTQGMKAALASLKSGSFHSVQIAWQQLLLGKSWSRKEAACKEWEMAHHFSKNNEFHEGIRAMLIDKDKQPKWNKTPLNEQEVDQYFENIDNNPVRSALKS